MIYSKLNLFESDIMQSNEKSEGRENNLEMNGEIE